MPANLSRKNRFNQKRDISVFAAMVSFSDLAGSGTVHQLAQLPSEIAITRAEIIVHTPFNTGTTATANLGVNGGNALVAAADLKGAAESSTGDMLTLLRDTGGVLTFTPTLTGAAATAGKVLVYVEYIEYTKVTGELTSFVPEA